MVIFRAKVIKENMFLVCEFVSKTIDLEFVSNGRQMDELRIYNHKYNDK